MSPMVCVCQWAVMSVMSKEGQGTSAGGALGIHFNVGRERS